MEKKIMGAEGHRLILNTHLLQIIVKLLPLAGKKHLPNTSSPILSSKIIWLSENSADC